MLSKLPEHIRELADAAFKAFCDNPQHPALSNHPLDDTHKGRHRKQSRSISITHRYRAVYVIDDDRDSAGAYINLWYWVGTHNDYNIFVGRK
jgi:hypothetical protein